MAKGVVGTGSVVGLVVASALLMGFVGGVTDCPGFENTQRRFRAVGTRTETVTISGFADSYGYLVCAYQQTRDAGVWATLGCVYPTSSSSGTDNCNVNWYAYTLTVPLLGGNRYWFGQHNPATASAREYTTVSVNANGGQGGLFTFTGDAASGPMDTSACYRSQASENGAISPITFYLGGVPPERDCATGANSYDGCPFTCNLPLGCDTSYSQTQNEFYNSGYRSNRDGQSTALTRFDHYGANASAGTPSGDWSYQWENQGSYIVMHRGTYSADSLNIRRGENRRNTRVEAYIKMAAANSYNQQLGLINRHYDANNYFAFMLHEYPYDAVRLHAYQNGSWVNLATTYPVLNLLTWNRVGFVVQDRGSYTASGFAPNGYCYLGGLVNGSTVVSMSNTYCGFAPTGRYGVFSWYHMSPQFCDLDAFPLSPLGPYIPPPPVGPIGGGGIIKG